MQALVGMEPAFDIVQQFLRRGMNRGQRRVLEDALKLLLRCRHLLEIESWLRGIAIRVTARCRVQRCLANVTTRDKVRRPQTPR